MQCGSAAKCLHCNDRFQAEAEKLTGQRLHHLKPTPKTKSTVETLL